MKIVIIGGGVGGLTLGLLLRRKNFEVNLSERTSGKQSRGHAFLMHEEGLSVLRNLNDGSIPSLKGNHINSFKLCRPNGKEEKFVSLESWQCYKRCTIIEYLYALYPPDIIKDGREFSHFIYKNGKANAAVFANGDIEYGDIFIGADGGNSKVRENAFGNVTFTPVKVKEIVGIVKNKKIAKKYANQFNKFQSKTKGLAVGFIPTSEDELVWFMQFDPNLSNHKICTSAELKEVCQTLLAEFPPIVSELLELNDFSTTYTWNTRDFDMLPKFHEDNIALIGDAAHLSLPFTSAGTTNAIKDAQTVVECLLNSENYNLAFKKYYDLRVEEVTSHVELGRNLQVKFLRPLDSNEKDNSVPLIHSKPEHRINIELEEKEIEPTSKPIQVLYFTDPICSTCWVIQPVLRKLKLEYGKYVNFEYKMGGLLPNWVDYKKGKISNPTDAAKHWEEAGAIHEMPIDGDVWIEDPLSSSYPPSIAFKAAQMQDSPKALLFLRRLQEMLFLEKKNIIKWEFLKEAAIEVGLNAEQLLEDFQNKGQELFTDDLIISSQLGVTSFPTFFFSDGTNHFKLKGFQEYEKLEETILKLIPGAKKEIINTSPKKLFNQFNSMTEKEFAFFSNRPKESAVQILNSLFEKGILEKFESKNGVIWKNRFSLPFDMQSSFNTQGSMLINDVICKAPYKCENDSLFSNVKNKEIKPESNAQIAKANKVEPRGEGMQGLEKEYYRLNAICQSYGEELVKQLNHILEKNDIKLVIPIQFRSKPWDSILQKITEDWLSNHSSIMDLDDLSGIRIILMFEKDTEKTQKLIHQHFKLLKEFQTNSEEPMLGYPSLNLIIELNDEWFKIPTFSEYKGIKSEVQIRTFAQHAWAETSDCFFQTNQELPPRLKKKLTSISNLLETVDLEFSSAKQDYDNLTKKPQDEPKEKAIVKNCDIVKPKNKSTEVAKDDALDVDLLSSILFSKNSMDIKVNNEFSILLDDLKKLSQNGTH